MKPATIVLIVAGGLSVIGGGFIASVLIPADTELVGGFGEPTRMVIERNMWGHSLRASVLTNYTMKPNSIALQTWTIDEGPYPNEVRQGHWTREIKPLGGKEILSDHWYIDGQEVSEADWRAGRKPPPEPR